MTGEGIATDPDKIHVIKEWRPLKDLTDARGFLGLCSYYRRFIPELLAHAILLTKLTEKNQEFSWGTEQEGAWCELRHQLTNAYVLAYPDPK